MPTLKPYPAYADTDLPWLPKIPKHWDVQRAKWQFSDSIDKNHPEETLLSVTQGQGVVARSDAEMRVWNPGDDISGYKLVEPNEFVISLRSFEGGIEISYIRGIVSPAYVVLHPVHKEYNEYFRHLFKSRDFISLLNISTSGIRQGKNITFWDFRELSIPIPPLSEQRTIAAYLDRQTAKIDALIAKKQRLLDLLAEQRAALISQAVTKGNAINIIQKDKSPAPWLFTLPAGWKRQQLKHISFTKGRIGYENLRAEEYTDEGPYLVSSAHFKDGKIEWDRCNHVTRERFEMSPEIILQTHDVLFMKDGALMGKLAFVDELPGEACLNSHILLIRPLKESYVPKFLYYVLMTDVFKAYMEEQAKGTTFLGFSEQSMGNFPLSLPPISEQKEICDYIDRKTEQLDDLATKANDVIERLQEYRAALISSVVTGKVDVSEVN